MYFCRCISFHEDSNSSSTTFLSDDYLLIEEVQRKFLPPIINVASWELKSEGDDNLSEIVQRFNIQAIIAGFGLNFSLFLILKCDSYISC